MYTHLAPITPRAQRMSGMALLLAAALGLYLRWWNLGGQSLWFDEGFTVWLASHSISDIIRIVRADTAPPLYYLLLHGWMGIFGESELALRSFSATCATLVLLIVYLIARRLRLNWRATAATMAILAMSVLHVRYARDARCYALLSVFAALQLLAAVEYRRSRRLSAYFGFIIASAAMMYTHNLALPYVGMGMIVWWFFAKGTARQRLFQIAGLCAGITLLYLPWVGSFLSQMRNVDGSFWISTPGWTQLLRSMQVAIGLREDFAGNALSPALEPHMQIWGLFELWLNLVSLLMVISTIGIATVFAVRDRLIRAIALYAFVPIVFVFLYSQVRTPIMIDRVFIPSSAAVAIVAGLLVMRRPRWMLFPLVSAVMLAGTSSVGFIGHERKEDWRSAVRFLENTGMETDRAIIFLANEGELLYRYYEDRTDVEKITGLPKQFLDSPTPTAMQRVRSKDDLRPLRELLDDGTREIVLVLCHASRDPDKSAVKLLDDTCRLLDRRQFHEITVLRYLNEQPFVETTDAHRRERRDERLNPLRYWSLISALSSFE